MSTKYKVVLAAIALLGAFAAGRYLAPEKIKIEKQIVEVEKKSSNKDAEKNTRKTTTVTKTTYPDGRVEERTVVVEETDRKSSSTTVSEGSKTENEVTEVTHSSSRVTISALAGAPTSSLQLPVYGVAISKPVLGPITVGAWGLSSGVIGASLGLTF